MRILRFLIIIIIFYQPTYSQNRIELNRNKIELLESIGKYCKSELGMNISESFYSTYAESENPNYYLYVSVKDSIGRPSHRGFNYRNFGFEFEKANIEKEEYENYGYSTHLYKTYGTASTKLSNHLLSYTVENIAFIAFHEATHQHIRSDNKFIPYVIEEAVCDLIGNYGTLQFSKTNNLIRKRKAVRQLKSIEDFSSEINKVIAEYNLAKTYDTRLLEKKIKKFENNKNLFLNERYNYEINNAYLLRNKNYTFYYFRLKEIMESMPDLKTFLEFVTNLPNNERRALNIMEEKIKNLK